MSRLGALAILSMLSFAALARGLSTPHVVDEVYSAKEGAPPAVAMVLYVDRPWNEFTKFRDSLHEKLSAYADFVASGELVQTYPWAKGKPVRVIVMLLFPPTPEAIAYLDQFKPEFRRRGITMQWLIPQNVKKAL